MSHQPGDLPFCKGGVIDEVHEASCPAPHGDPTAQPVYVVPDPRGGISTAVLVGLVLIIVSLAIIAGYIADVFR